MRTRLIEPACECQTIGGNCQNMDMGVGTGGGLDAPIGGFLELPKTHQRHGARAEHAEEQRVERAQMARVVGGPDGSAADRRACECTNASV